MNIDHMNFERPLQGEWFSADCAVELLLHSALEFQMRAQSPGASVLAAAISGAEIQIAFVFHRRAYVPQTWKKRFASITTGVAVHKVPNYRSKS